MNNNNDSNTNNSIGCIMSSFVTIVALVCNGNCCCYEIFCSGGHSATWSQRVRIYYQQQQRKRKRILRRNRINRLYDEDYEINVKEKTYVGGWLAATVYYSS
mmetsp:Transcript_7557/g.7456  ORF Transcript_7557/g.7456 Transcript_7557/m.7456 type:complete len:102 (+) Transcript_7557:185-490(+)